jgi:CMP/dCMP kinase
MIIAIDGPAGAGKSTVAKLVAKRLGFTYLDTGAMYRAVTVAALENNLELNDEIALVALAEKAKIEIFSQKDGSLKISLNGADVTRKIREVEVNKNVSFIAKVPKLRAVMVERQREFSKDHDIVVEGRDIGTVVFPSAEKKFYLDADFKERSRRRIKELSESGVKVNNSEIEKDIEKRDHQDLTRSVAPLKKADDAFYIDTTPLSIDEVVNKILSFIKI